MLLRKELVKGELKKISYNPIGNYRASSTDPTSWGTFEHAVSKLDKYEGLSIAVIDPYCVVDIDHCVDKGEPNDNAKSVIDAIRSYNDISPSGTGLHIIARAKKKTDRCRKTN